MRVKPRFPTPDHDDPLHGASRSLGQTVTESQHLALPPGGSTELDPRSLTPAGALRLQRLIGNQQAGQFLGKSARRELPIQMSGEPLAAPAIQRDITFTRFTRYGRLSNWGGYNDQEKSILDRARRVGELLTGLASYQQDSRFGRKVVALQQRFDKVDGNDYAEKDYNAVAGGLREIFNEADNLSSSIAARGFRQDKDLDNLLANAFEKVGDQDKRTKPHQLSAAELRDLKALLNDIFQGQKSNLVIDVQMPFANLDLAQRAESLGLDAPPELLPLELKIHHLESQALEIGDNRLGELIAAKFELQSNKSMDAEERKGKVAEVSKEIEAIKEKQRVLQDQADDLKADYKAIVEEMVKRTVLKDLVTIAQTGVGRDLLREVAKTSMEKNAKLVTIRAYDQFVAATAGQDTDKKTPYVNYTPQYFRDRDTKQREPEGAITKADALAADNPWQEDRRTDVTLFHELVHTHHYQSGTAMTDGKLVSAEDAVAPVDQPYETDDGPKGVREEEYFTVGLGKYADERFTENAYRGERRQLGEEIELRDYYTHRDKEGRPIALGS